MASVVMTALGLESAIRNIPFQVSSRNSLSHLQICRGVFNIRRTNKEESSLLVVSAAKSSNRNISIGNQAINAKKDAETVEKHSGTAEELGEEYYEEEESWLEEKVGDVYEFTVSALEVVPGPRVGSSDFPWLVAAPLGYLGITFVWSIIRLVQKYNSPKAKRRRQIGKNALLCELLDDYLPEKWQALTSNELQKLAKQLGFSTEEILRKYIRYSLNEKPFNPEHVADLIQLRNASGLSDGQVADVLNDVSRRIVKAKGPIVMDTEGMTEKGVKRKAAVQGLFSKLYYLSESEEFCSSSVHEQLQLKIIFGITDEDANSIKIETLSESADLSSLENMMNSTSANDGETTESESDEAES